MRYAQIRKMDISNGEGCGVALFTQGCPLHCPNCHNASIWGFNDGKIWDKDAEQTVIDLLNRPQIARLSILGGEPLLDSNIQELAYLCNHVKQLWPQKKIWLWSGYLWEEIYDLAYNDTTFIGSTGRGLQTNWNQEDKGNLQIILENVDVLVDGPFIQEKKDLTLKWRGSSNQRVISCAKSVVHGLKEYPILYCL